MKRCLITERTCPLQYDICCHECGEECANKCTSIGCPSYVEMDTGMVQFESKYLTVLKQVALVEKQLKNLKAQSDEIKDSLLDAMQKNGIKKFENEFISMTVVDAHVAQKFDSKALQQLEPETYSKYLTVSEVKASVRIKAK